MGGERQQQSRTTSDHQHPLGTDAERVAEEGLT